jgi:hypothetical protein
LQLADGTWLSADTIYYTRDEPDGTLTVATATSIRTYEGADAEAIRNYVLAHQAPPAARGRHHG